MIVGLTLYLHLMRIHYIYIIYIYRRCQNYRTKLRVQKYGKIPYLRTPPDPDSGRIRILFYNIFFCSIIIFSVLQIHFSYVLLRTREKSDTEIIIEQFTQN